MTAARSETWTILLCGRMAETRAFYSGDEVPLEMDSENWVSLRGDPPPR
jgi:hypothetical protein